MNGKQSRMLRHMRATTKEVKAWHGFSKYRKGILRISYESCTKMIWMGFSQALEYADKHTRY